MDCQELTSAPTRRRSMVQSLSSEAARIFEGALRARGAVNAGSA